MGFLEWLKQFLSQDQITTRAIKGLSGSPREEINYGDLQLLDSYLKNNKRSGIPTRNVGQASFYNTAEAQNLAKALRTPVISSPSTSLDKLIRTQIESYYEPPLVKTLRGQLPPDVSMRYERETP